MLVKSKYQENQVFDILSTLAYTTANAPHPRTAY